MFDLVNKEIQQYCDAHTTPETDTLRELNRHTFANVLQPRMLSGHFQGRLLSLFSQMIKPKFILEIGTYTGYSAICLAEGMQPDGKLITIDINPEHESSIYQFIEKAGMQNRIQFIVGDAKNIMKTLPQKFDLVFIDADKPSYLIYYNLAMDALNKGGYIIADNVLWSGKVVNQHALQNDNDTKLLNTFNNHIAKDERVEQIMLPLRDGLMVVRKK